MTRTCDGHHVVGDGSNKRCIYCSEEGERGKRDGMDRVERHAPTEWNAAADHALRFIARVRHKFTTDAVWAVLDKQGVGAPPQPRAMGPVVRRAILEGIIEETDDPHIKSVRPSQHRFPKAVWRSKVYKARLSATAQVAVDIAHHRQRREGR